MTASVCREMLHMTVQASIDCSALHTLGDYRRYVRRIAKAPPRVPDEPTGGGVLAADSAASSRTQFASFSG